MNSNGSYTYTAKSPGFVGKDTFSYQIKDPAGQIVTALETINVTSPTINAIGHTYSTPFNTMLTTGNAATGDSVEAGSKFTVVTNKGPSHGTVQMNLNGTYTYTPALNFVGQDTFTY